MNNHSESQNLLNEEDVHNYFKKHNITVDKIIDIIVDNIYKMKIIGNNIDIKKLIQIYFINNKINDTYIIQMIKGLYSNLENIEFKIAKKLADNFYNFIRPNTNQSEQSQQSHKNSQNLEEHKNEINLLKEHINSQNNKIDFLLKELEDLKNRMNQYEVQHQTNTDSYNSEDDTQTVIDNESDNSSQNTHNSENVSENKATSKPESEVEINFKEIFNNVEKIGKEMAINFIKSFNLNQTSNQNNK
jgi:hypothetical protein